MHRINGEAQDRNLVEHQMLLLDTWRAFPEVFHWMKKRPNKAQGVRRALLSPKAFSLPCRIFVQSAAVHTQP